jgi:3-oxoacyl-[acyl-carrier-protein] synthase II
MIETEHARRAGAAPARRVVITGLGAVSPVGHSAPATWEAFVAGRSGVDRVQSFDASCYPARIAAEIKGFDPAAHIPLKEARRMSRCSQIAVVAAREAVTDAGLDWAQEDRERAAVILGTGMGGIELLIEPIGKLARDGSVRITPHTAMEHLANMPAFHVGLEHGCQGTLSTIITACAAGTQAIGEGLELIRRGRTDIVLAGGTESQVNPLFFTGFSAMRVLSTRNEEPQRASRPFDAQRDGFVIGEGAGVFVLEELDHARRRAARIYAELLGQASSADAYHIAQPEPTGVGPARTMRWALEDAGVAPEAVDYVNAHGSATVQNDAAETAAIKRVFGEHAYRLVVNSTKSMIGHCFGAAGVIEGLATVMAVHTDTVHPTVNLENPDPACDLDYVPNVARQRRVDVAISNSFGLGGQNACIVIAKYKE